MLYLCLTSQTIFQPGFPRFPAVAEPRQCLSFSRAIVFFPLICPCFQFPNTQYPPHYKSNVPVSGKAFSYFLIPWTSHSCDDLKLVPLSLSISWCLSFSFSLPLSKHSLLSQDLSFPLGILLALRCSPCISVYFPGSGTRETLLLTFVLTVKLIAVFKVLKGTRTPLLPDSMLVSGSIFLGSYLFGYPIAPLGSFQ